MIEKLLTEEAKRLAAVPDFLKSGRLSCRFVKHVGQGRKEEIQTEKASKEDASESCWSDFDGQLAGIKISKGIKTETFLVFSVAALYFSIMTRNVRLISLWRICNLAAVASNSVSRCFFDSELSSEVQQLRRNDLSRSFYSSNIVPDIWPVPERSNIFVLSGFF